MLERGCTAMTIIRDVLNMTEYYLEFWILTLLVDLQTVPTLMISLRFRARLTMILRRSAADINMVYVTPINCRLIQPTDGFLAYVIQQDATTQEWSRYNPSIRSWIRDNSVSQLSFNPMDVQIPVAALTTTVKYVQTLFDSGASHIMVSNAKYFVPHSMINLNGLFARTASCQILPVVAVG